MSELKLNLSFCSFNCRSLKNSLFAVRELCNTHDFVLLQEHWLLPFELDLLNSTHTEFYATGSSAVNISNDVLIGRPYGGTAILYHKNLAKSVQILESHNSRITCLKITTDAGPVLLMNVYMPTNYGDDESLQSYIEICANLNSIIIDSDAVHTIIAGDFNCDRGSRFYSEFLQFAADTNLVLSDLIRLNDVVTYVSDDGRNTSWLDHILCSAEIDNKVLHVSILNDVIASDHKPLSFKISCTLKMCSEAANNTGNVDLKCKKPDWNACDAATLATYERRLDCLLQSVHIPYHAMTGDNSSESSCTTHLAIDSFYNDIVECIRLAVSNTIPHFKQKATSDYNVPGWNDYVEEKHEAAREAFKQWYIFGKPRNGYVYECMKRTRAVFKLALRYCRNHIDQIKADVCASNLNNKNPQKFWNSVYKISNSKSTTHVAMVGGACGDHAIADMWKDHFENLYNSVDNTVYQDLFNQKKIAASIVNNIVEHISVLEVTDAVRRQKKGKAMGPDDLSMESFIYGGPRLNLLLSILFNLCLQYEHLPLPFREAIIVPLVKSKIGDLADVNNYRAIAISSPVSKVLESIILKRIESQNDQDDYQFGFKKSHSTLSCTYLLKNTVDYYSNRGSHVFACFIDFNKAFDRVNYWQLFCKLLDQGMPRKIVYLLAFWYRNQRMCIKWQNVTSCHFNIGNGVRQGGVLSPFLFRFYIQDLISTINKSRIGCNIGSIFVNLLAYADDMVLLAPSWYALQMLLDGIQTEADAINMTFNTTKTVCMVFNPRLKNRIVSENYPPFQLSGCRLAYVTSFKYLGHIIENDLSDDRDINREIKSLYTRTNILIRRFSRCSIGVKIKLFKTYCICLYDAALWKKYTVKTMSHLVASYHKCIKLFFGLDKYCSVTGMLMELGLPCFNTLVHNYNISMVNQLNNICKDNLTMNAIISLLK